MKFIDVGSEAQGVIAVGGMATGVFALGQIAFGFIAIGQGAVGVFAFGQGAIGMVAIGQGSAGLFTVGMLSVGLHACAAMVGIGGRGFGGVISLTPWLGPASQPPATTTLEAVRDGAEGWVPLHLSEEGTVLTGADEPSRLDARVVAAARDHGDEPVFAWLQHDTHGFLATRLMARRPPRWRRAKWWKLWAIQLILLFALAFGIWLGVMETLFALVGL